MAYRLQSQRSRRASSRRPSLSESWIERQLDGNGGGVSGGRSTAPHTRHMSMSESWIEEQLAPPLGVCGSVGGSVGVGVCVCV